MLRSRSPRFVVGGLLGLTLAVVGLLVYGFRVNWFGAPPGPVVMEGCIVSQRGVLPNSPSPFPHVSNSDWARGPVTAAVTIILYQDFQCPTCATLADNLAVLAREAPSDFRVVFRHLPLETLHDKARLAAQAAEAAGAQTHFWEMHDALFKRQAEWHNLSKAEFQTWLVEQAQSLGLDTAQFAADLISVPLVAKIEQAHQTGIALGLNGTPTLVFNGHYYEGPKDRWTLSSYIQVIKLEQRWFKTCPLMEIQASKHYSATLHTTKGDIVIELFPAQALLAVNSFVYLVRQNWYDNVPFYRVYPGFAAQTGDPSGTGLGGPGYTFRDEIHSDLHYDAPGLVGMANSGPDSNGSQFFITYAPQPSLDGKYTLFGKVVTGLNDVALKLTKRDPATNPLDLPEPDRIISITLEIR